jgi:hypothetical protein
VVGNPNNLTVDISLSPTKGEGPLGATSSPTIIGRHNWRAYRRKAQFGCGVISCAATGDKLASNPKIRFFLVYFCKINNNKLRSI